MNRKAVLFLLILLLIGCGPSTAIPTQKIQDKRPGGTLALITQSPPPTHSATPPPFPFLFTFPDFPLDTLIQQRPETCPGVGIQAYSEPPIEPITASLSDETIIVLTHGAVIVVTTNLDESNGDTSSLEALLANPGPDGVSLREALLVTNHDPGEYTIQFDPSLSGAAIQVGSWDHTELPPLEGGSVIINGDIDGDLEPDIMLENATGEVKPGSSFFGFQIHSSRNTLHALKMIGFGDSILFDAPSTHTVYYDNTLSHLVIESYLGGINLYSGKGGEGEPIQESRNTWLNTRVIGNRITAQSGIGFALHWASKDKIDGLIIKDNQILINLEGKSQGGNGIALSPGFGSEFDGNHIENVIIQGNFIGGNSNSAISLGAGIMGASSNLIRDIYILENTISTSGSGIDLASGYGENARDNLMQFLLIANNLIEGNAGSGITLFSGGMGSGNNAIKDIYILENTIRKTYPLFEYMHTFGVQISAGFWVNQEGNEISNIVVAGNSIEGNPEMSVLISSGSVGSSRNLVERVIFSNNRIITTQPAREDTGIPLNAIVIATGDGATDYYDASYQPVVYPNDNILRDIWISNNLIKGQGGGGVMLSTGVNGVERNLIENIYILGNEIDAFFPEKGIMINSISLTHGGNGDNRISQVYIQQNSISYTNLRNEFSDEEFVSGGIILASGNGPSHNITEDIWIIANDISSPAPGINLVAGWSPPYLSPSMGNLISDVRLWCNLIPEKPILLESLFPGIKGINLAGGWGLAQDNRVENIDIEKNLVAGVEDDVSVFDNAGEGCQSNFVHFP